jgi:hypothetical protein
MHFCGGGYSHGNQCPSMSLLSEGNKIPCFGGHETWWHDLLLAVAQDTEIGLQRREGRKPDLTFAGHVSES